LHNPSNRSGIDKTLAEWDASSTNVARLKKRIEEFEIADDEFKAVE
jgi:hypothetical protein